MDAVERLDLNLLKVFLAIYDTGKVGDAALRLGLSQPGLSSALRRLRVSLGDPLFIRTPHGMEPTLRARSLIEPMRRIFRSIETEIVEARQFDPATAMTRFTLALTDMGEATFLPEAVKVLHAAAPNVTIRAVTLRPKELETSMEAGEVDLACGYFPDIVQGPFYQQVIGPHSFTCLLRRGHRLKGTKLSLDAFCTAEHAVVAAESRSQEVFESFLRKQRITRRVLLQTPHFLSIPVVVAATDMLVTVPQALADYIVRQGAVREIGLPFKPPEFQVKMYWHRSAHQEPRHVWLRSVLIPHFRRLNAARRQRLATLHKS